ncbi:nucleotidyltransferase [Thermotalea metallivorans]|uniref:tRNA(Met) cytidine acetate ligase n=1 Tax=Thermotalea metallivorans TaxID=520762 RepID=A0A140L629_9FIRM|nr:nucleotidyltransferase [Thermotalea metallivorans]KXG76004.1 hypothetical protein AN619_14680 [Thermotalea metallivorans]
MKVLGLITEYNPFHNGHKYHLEESKRITGATHTIAVMSGNFLQRGEPAITNKWFRAEMAVREGIDLVIELPFAYACNSAEYFAFGAVSLLHHLNIVDFLCFGSEEGNMEKLKKICRILVQEPEDYQQYLKQFLSQGLPFPKAREQALARYFMDESIGTLLQSPNNILGVEYIKSLLKLNSPIQPFTIKRIKAPYHSREIIHDICSATAIRSYLSCADCDIRSLSKVMPPGSFHAFARSLETGFGPIRYSDFDTLILYNLRRISTEDLRKIQDIGEGLENRIKAAAIKSTSVHELFSAIKTKRYTMTRLQRILIHSLLGLQKNHVCSFNRSGGAQYGRILAFSQNSGELIRVLKKKSAIPIVTNINKESLTTDVAKQMLAFDLMATDIYSLAYPKMENRRGGWDYSQKPFIL